MAEHYVSDDEQVEAIKKWWKTNGMGIVAGLVIGAVGVLGWQYWGSYQTERAEQASLFYDALRGAMRGNDAAQIREQGEILLNDYDDTAYATLAALMLAKVEVQDGNPEAAAQHLQWVLDNASQAVVKDLARVRLARVRLSEGRLDDAEAQLSQVHNFNLTAEVEELRGDIHVARGDVPKARIAYEAAQAAAGPTGGELLQIKLDNLPAEGAQG